MYKKVDILKVCEKFYDGIGLPINDVLTRSDLYEKPKKESACVLHRYQSGR